MQGSAFQAQLNHLIAAMPGRVTNVELVQGLAERGCVISKPYLSQLRTGQRANPSAEVVAGLADMFDVEPDFLFTSTDRAAMTEVAECDSSTVDRLEQAALRDLLRTALGLSEEGQRFLVSMAEKLRNSDPSATSPPRELVVRPRTSGARVGAHWHMEDDTQEGTVCGLRYCGDGWGRGDLTITDVREASSVTCSQCLEKIGRAEISA